MKRKIIIISSLLIIYSLLNSIFAMAASQPPLRPDNFTANYPVYNSSTNEYTIELNWSPSAGADLYILEISTQTNWANQTISEEKQVFGTTYNDLRQNTSSNPISGTIFKYNLYAATYVRDENGDPTSDYVKSSTYASVTVLTDPQTIAKAVSTSEIELKWDDIQYMGDSISYELVKYKKGLKVGQDQIRAEDIGTTIRRENGKIVYSVTNLDKSTEYTFELKPSLDSQLVKFNATVNISGATKISAYLQRYNENIMKFIWDEYQGSIAANNLYYKVYEITEANGQKSRRVIATPEVPYYFIQLKLGEEISYQVEVRRVDDDSIVAESAEISLKDVVIPATPPTPTVTYTTTNNSITLNWDTGKTIDGIRDTAMRYDVWFMADPNHIDNIRSFYSPSSTGIPDERIGTNLEIVNGVPSNVNFSLITVGGNEKYRFNINNLTYNSIYYVAVVAKKTYLIQDPDDQTLIINLTYNSEPAIEAIQTVSGNIEQPISLVKPLGISVKTDANGNAMVTGTTVNIKWPLGETVNNTFTSFYQSDVYFKVGYEVYTPSFDKGKINDPSNVNYNLKTNGVTITQNQINTESYAVITGLTVNTQYVFWVKAFRNIPNTSIIKVSEALDPIIVSTLPDYTMPDEKPTVPTISVIDNVYHDKISVQFNSVSGYRYTIAWSKIDNISQKSGQKDYTAVNGANPDTVVIEGLEPETTYYFWVMATNNNLNSEWSQSVLGKTTLIPPPDAPSGFGVKKIVVNGELLPDIGDHYIYLQWDKIEGLEYIIEVSTNSDFSESELIEANDASEYKLENFKDSQLASNTRYWIRLFAKDPDTEKLSQNSTYLSIKTKFNYDEYDSSAVNKEPITGKTTEETISGRNGTWEVEISSVNGDRIIEKIKDNALDEYRLDLSSTSVSGITKREISIPFKVLQTLSQNDQNFVIATDKSEISILPESIDIDKIDINPSQGEDVVLLFTISNTSQSAASPYSNLSYASEINLSASTSHEEKIINDFNKPIKIKIRYTDSSSTGVVDPYYQRPGSAQWEKLSGEKTYENNNLYMNIFDSRIGKYIVRRLMPDTVQYGNSQYADDINVIMNSGLIKCIDKDNIKASSLITFGDAVKILLDATGTRYTDEYIDIANKAGIISALDDTTPSRYLTRQEALSMVMRLYEIKTGEILPSIPISSSYKDISSIKPGFRVYLGNGLNMGIMTPNGTYLKPNEYITRAEMLAYTKRILSILGII